MLCITSDEGKINLNQIFDFKKKQFINKQTRDALQALFASMKRFTQKDLFAPLEKYLKQRSSPFVDVTELLDIKEFQEQFTNSLFYSDFANQTSLQLRPTGASSDRTPKTTIFLTDIFTLHSAKPGINAWTLSNSIADILGLQRPDSQPWQVRKKEVEELVRTIKNIDDKVEAMWNQYLKKLYGKDFKALQKPLIPLLYSSLSFKYFTVLSYGTVGSVTQKLAAHIERMSDTEFLIKKVYWI